MSGTFSTLSGGSGGGAYAFTSVTVPVGASVWTVPAKAKSKTSQFLVTARTAVGSDLSVRVTASTQTTFTINAPVESLNATIFYSPIL